MSADMQWKKYGKGKENNMKIQYAKVYGINNAFKCSKYPFCINTMDATDYITDRIEKLASCDIGTGHDNFLNGIVVQFDLTFSNKAWVEMERYHFIDFISSQSTMHCISKMDIKNCVNEYVTQNTIDECERLKLIYLENASKENYLRLLYNIPSGFELTAGMTTNYRQLKTIYAQRKNHTLPEWREFCRWIESLPYSYLITGKEK